MKKTRIKIKWRNVFLFLFLIMCMIGIFISLFHIVKWKLDCNKTDKNVNKIYNIVKPSTIKDTSDTEIIKPDNTDKTDPYWDYIKMDLMNVDLSKLEQTNRDTVGWIQVKGTNINYPFVKTSDNKFYLNHSFDKSYNSAGWVFMDYRNNETIFDRNTIIYAHGRYDSTMFGSLKNILSSKWIQDTNNYVITLSTPYEDTLWQIFSGYRIKTTSDYLQIDFSSDDEFLKFAQNLKERSAYNFKTSVTKKDKILTLSTCYNEEEKVVLHAKLIKRKRN